MASDVLFEIQQLGNTVKATAIDATTGQEAVVLAPLTISRHDLQLLALRKLRYLQGRKTGEEAPTAGPPKGKGIVV